MKVSILMIWLAMPHVVFGQTDTEKTGVAMITPETERGINVGLELLASRQHDNGSSGSGSYRGNAAVSALVGLAFMSEGSTPGRGPYGENVQRCVDYLLGVTQQSGFITAAPSHGPMYGHGFAAMFLGQCYGMSPRPELREKLAAAVKLIVNTQNQEGGWRYQPQKLEADLSVTVCQVMALRAARNCGIYVPRDSVDRAIDFVKRSQNADGGFMYMLHGGDSVFARSAAGLVALYSAGVYEGPEIEKGIQYLLRFRPEPGVVRRETYYYYGHYYAVQAMWQAGDEDWKAWYPAIRDELLSRQEPDGSWMSPICNEYATAMALIILQIPNNCVPIFQK